MFCSLNIIITDMKPNRDIENDIRTQSEFKQMRFLVMTIETQTANQQIKRLILVKEGGLSLKLRMLSL